MRELIDGAAEVLGDARFLLMIVVRSWFWILYFQNLGTVLWRFEDFVELIPVNWAISGLFGALGLPAWFSFEEEHVTVINAGTIIALQLVVSRLVRDRKALPTMSWGMAIGALGFVLLALSQRVRVFVLGIAVFSIGERTTHRPYWSFIGLVAQADRKALNMGCAFLQGVFSSLLGANIGACLYKAVLESAVGGPHAQRRALMFWLLFAAMGVAAAMRLMFFARRFGVDKPQMRCAARRAIIGVYSALATIGLGFVVHAVSSTPIEHWAAVQALLFVALGAGARLVTRAGKSAGPDARPGEMRPAG